MAIRRIGQIFVDMGFISDEQLEMLLEEQQQRPGTLLGKIALELNMLSEEQVIQALAEQMGMQVVELGDTIIPHEVIQNYRKAFAQTRSLTYRLIDGADHGLTDQAWRHAYTTLLVNWITEMIAGKRTDAVDGQKRLKGVMQAKAE